MPDTPLNPDAILEAARASRHALWDEDFWGFSSESDAQDYGFEEGAKWAQKQLAVAQPKVNTFDPRELNRRGWTCGCEPGNYDECDDCLTTAHELANFLNRPEVKP